MLLNLRSAIHILATFIVCGGGSSCNRFVEEPMVADAGPSCPAVGSCPVGWFAGDCGCYKFPPQSQARWEEGIALCGIEGGLLVQIETETENIWLTDFLGERTWLGLGLPAGETLWSWTSGDLLGNYNSWSSGIVPGPQPAAMQCASTMNGVWLGSIVCDDNLSILCESNQR